MEFTQALSKTEWIWCELGMILGLFKKKDEVKKMFPKSIFHGSKK
jgi:hypothetical protein